MTTAAGSSPTSRTVRMWHYYTLGTLIPLSAEEGEPTPPKLELDRFHKHTQQDGFPSLSVVLRTTLRWPDIAISGAPLDRSGDIDVQIWRANEVQLLLRLSHEHEGDVESISEVLRCLCHDRSELTIQSLPIHEWVAHQLPEPDRPSMAPKPDGAPVIHTAGDALRVTQDVVQFVAVPTPTAAAPALTIEEQAKVIRRDFAYSSSNPHAAFKAPSELNRTGDEYAGHGRGVVLLGGHPEHHINAVQLIALHLVLGVSRLRMMRYQIKDRLRVVKGGVKTQTLDGLRDSSEVIRQNLITMSVEVSDWFDGVWMPEIVLDGFRMSFTETLDAHALRDSTQHLLTSLSSVIETYRREFELRAAKQSQKIQENWHLFVAVLSAAVIPFAILISYFGVSSQETAPPGDSIFSRAYLGAWVGFVIAWLVILLFAALVRRNSKRSAEADLT